jgi:hypothetical protein
LTLKTYSEYFTQQLHNTFFSTACGIFSNVEYILGHKASLNKFKKIEITLCILSDHNGIKLQINNKRNYRKYSNTWRLNNPLLNGKMREKSNFLESNENENKTYQILWKDCAKSKGYVKRKDYTSGSLYQKT